MSLIVYLIVLHVRLVTPHKGWWTAVLATIGRAVETHRALLRHEQHVLALRVPD